MWWVKKNPWYSKCSLCLGVWWKATTVGGFYSPRRHYTYWASNCNNKLMIFITQGLLQMCESAPKGKTKGCPQQRRPHYCCSWRLQLPRIDCVVLQSPAISLFTEVKAVSCRVPGASIPIQWVIGACTGKLCKPGVSPYTSPKAAPHSRAQDSHMSSPFMSAAESLKSILSPLALPL